MLNNSVICYTLRTLCQSRKNSRSVVLTLKVVTSSLLGEFQAPACLKEISKFNPLCNITIHPPVTLCKSRKCRDLRFLKICNTLIQCSKATQIDGLAIVILWSCALACCLCERHLTVKVCHKHMAISIDNLTCTCIVPSLSCLSLCNHILNITSCTYKPPLIWCCSDAVGRVPNRHIPICTTTIVSCPVTQCHT